MNKNELLNLLDDTDNVAMQQFIGSNESKVEVNSSFQSVEYDYSWIDKIEETIKTFPNQEFFQEFPFLKKYLKNP